MTTWTNKATFSRFLDQAVNNGRLEVIDEIFADDFVGHFPEWDGPRQGPAAVREWVTNLRAGFPDMNALCEGNWMAGQVDHHHVGKGTVADRLAVYVVLRATHLGTYMDLEPTGSRIAVPQVHLLQFRDGQIIEDIAVTDRLAFLPDVDPAEARTPLVTPRRPAVLI